MILRLRAPRSQTSEDERVLKELFELLRGHYRGGPFVAYRDGHRNGAIVAAPVPSTRADEYRRMGLLHRLGKAFNRRELDEGAVIAGLGRGP